jgi:hypothetical protein
MSTQTLARRKARRLSSDTLREAHGVNNPKSTAWSAAQLNYMQWLATPEFARNPGTEAALARELGCSNLTLRLWRLRPAFRREVARLAGILRSGDLADLITSLERLAARGSAKHARLYHELMDLTKNNAEQSAGAAALVGLKLGDS